MKNERQRTVEPTPLTGGAIIGQCNGGCQRGPRRSRLPSPALLSRLRYGGCSPRQLPFLNHRHDGGIGDGEGQVCLRHSDTKSLAAATTRFEIDTHLCATASVGAKSGNALPRGYFEGR